MPTYRPNNTINPTAVGTLSFCVTPSRPHNKLKVFDVCVCACVCTGLNESFVAFMFKKMLKIQTNDCYGTRYYYYRSKIYHCIVLLKLVVLTRDSREVFFFHTL